MLQIVNLTRMNITIVDDKGNIVISYPSAGFAQCEVRVVKLREVDGVPINITKYKNITGLPAANDNANKVYIVDPPVAEAVRNFRTDVVIASLPVDEHGTFRALGIPA